jgi:hypothetical protein
LHLAQRVSRSSATGTTNANWRNMKREILIHKLNYFGTDAGGSLTSGVIQAGLGLDVSPFQKGFSHFSFRGEVRDFYFRYS